MESFFTREVLAHKYVVGAVGITLVIIAGSAWYYYSATAAPGNITLNTATSTPAILASGVVEPAQNPNLSFEVGGRVARVSAQVGQSVSQGAFLASLDTSVLSAQRLAAEAALKGQEAKLASLLAPARDVDVEVKQTAVDQSQATLDNQYATVSTALGTAYDISFSGLSAYTDSLFSNPDSATNPQLGFNTSNSSLAAAASSDRLQAKTTLAVWQSELAGISSASPQALDQVLVAGLAHLSIVRQYANDLLSALGNAIPSGSYTSSVIAADQTSVATYRDAINAQISALQAEQKNIATDKLSVQSSQDALNQLKAPASAQDIAAQEALVESAQASLANINAQIGQATIVAPYSGVVGSVQIKVGDTVTPNTTAITLDPISNLQVTAFVSEAQAGSIAVGSGADVVLDAYGASRHFPAAVVEVDRSPTMQEGVPAYKVTLQFTQNDPSIASGMTANVSITPSATKTQ